MSGLPHNHDVADCPDSWLPLQPDYSRSAAIQLRRQHHITHTPCCSVHRPPDAISQHVGLTSRQCSAGNELLDETARERYRQQVPGWRIQSNKDGLQSIRHEWTAKDADAAQQLVAKLSEVAQQQGHPLTHTDLIGTMVVAELTTAAKGERCAVACVMLPAVSCLLALLVSVVLALAVQERGTHRMLLDSTAATGPY